MKLFLSAGVIALASEFARHFPKVGGLIISLPLATILATFWLYLDTKSPASISEFLWSTLLFLIPSLVYFFAMVVLLKLGMNFYISFVASIVLTALAYFIYYRLVS